MRLAVVGGSEELGNWMPSMECVLQPESTNAKVHKLRLKASDQLLAAEFKFILLDVAEPGACMWETGENHTVSRNMPSFDPIGTVGFEPCVPYDGPWDIAMFDEKIPEKKAEKKPETKQAKHQRRESDLMRAAERVKIEEADKVAAAVASAAAAEEAAAARKQASAVAAEKRAAEENAAAAKRAEEALAEEKLAEELAVAKKQAEEELEAAELAAKEKEEQLVAARKAAASPSRRSSSSLSGLERGTVKFVVNGDGLSSDQRLLAVGGPGALGGWKPTMKCALQPCNDGTKAHKLLLDSSDELLGSEFKFVMVEAGRRGECRWESGDNHKVEGDTPVLGRASGFGDWIPFDGEWDDSIFELKGISEPEAEPEAAPEPEAVVVDAVVIDDSAKETTDVAMSEVSLSCESSNNGFTVEAYEEASSEEDEGDDARDFIAALKQSEPLVAVQAKPKGKGSSDGSKRKLLQSLFAIGVSGALLFMQLKDSSETKAVVEQKPHQFRFGGFRWSKTHAFTFQL